MAAQVHAYAINPGPAAWFMGQARRQRVHMAVLGNSNEFQNTGSAGGRLQAMHIKAAAAGIPIYGTPVMTLSGVDGTSGAISRNGFIAQAYPEFMILPMGTTAGNYYDTAPNGGTGLVRDPLDPANTTWLPLGLVHKWGQPQSAGSSYSTLAALTCMTGCTSSTPLAFANNGVQSSTLAPSDPNLPQWPEAFRGHFWMSDTTPAGGTARPGITVNGSLSTQTSAITVAAGTPTWRNLKRYTTGTVAAGSRAGAVRVGFTVSGGSALTGDVALSYFGVDWVNRTTGIRFGSPWSIGGASPLDIAYSLYGATRATPDETIYHYLQEACQPIADKDQDPVFCLVIADTLNMRNEAYTTAWQTAATADSAAAYAMHCAYIINRWQSVWNSLELFGSDGTTVVRTKASNFKVILSLDHPVTIPDDSEMVAFRETGGALLAAKFPDTVTTLRNDNIVSVAELYAVNSNAGYQPNTTRTLNAITTGATPTGTTTASHGLVVGQYVTLSGTNSTPTCNEVVKVLSTPTGTTFTFTPSAPITIAGTTGTVTIKDPAHLTKEGYEFYAGKLWSALLSLPTSPSTPRLRGR